MSALGIHPTFRPVIATARLVLRPLAENDRDDLVHALNDHRVSRMLARVPHPYAPANADETVRNARTVARARRGIASAITLRGQVIGMVNISGIPYRNGLGYWIARAHWGRGYATEAVRTLIAYVFDEIGVRQMRAGIYVDNAPSLRILTRLGFRPTGRRTSRSLAREGLLEHIVTVLPRPRYLDMLR